MARKRKASAGGVTKEILEGMRAWRKEHPKARYVEIEADLESRIKGN